MGAQQGHFAPALYATSTPYLGEPLASHHAKPRGPMPLQAIAPRPSSYDFDQSQLVAPSFHHNMTDFTHGKLPPGGQPSLPNPLITPNFPSDHEQGHFIPGLPHVYMDHLNVVQGPSVEDCNHDIDNGTLSHSTNGFVYARENEFDGFPSDEDCAMADSEDELPDQQALMASASNHLTWLYPRNGTQVRTFSAFAQERALYEYQNFAPNSALREDAMRTIFSHFISVTGPSMSLYERNASQSEDPGQFKQNAELGSKLFSCKPPRSNVLPFSHHPVTDDSPTA